MSSYYGTCFRKRSISSQDCAYLLSLSYSLSLLSYSSSTIIREDRDDSCDSRWGIYSLIFRIFLLFLTDPSGQAALFSYATLSSWTSVSPSNCTSDVSGVPGGGRERGDVGGTNGGAAGSFGATKQRLRPWLEKMISGQRIPGLRWINAEKTKFRIPWKHGGKRDWTPDSSRIFMVKFDL